MTLVALVTQVSGCRPYWSGNCAPDPAGDGCLPCAAVNECIDSGLAPTRFSVISVGAVVGSEHDLGQQVEAVQREIMRNGPVQARAARAVGGIRGEIRAMRCVLYALHTPRGERVSAPLSAYRRCACTYRCGADASRPPHAQYRRALTSSAPS